VHPRFTALAPPRLILATKATNIGTLQATGLTLNRLGLHGITAAISRGQQKSKRYDQYETLHM
jgi:hypothetical protein